MNLCLLLAELPEPGDRAATIIAALSARADVTLALTERRPLSKQGARFEGAHALAIEQLLGHDPFDAAVALGWEGTIRLFDVPATRYVHLVDEFAHERMGHWQPERVAAALSYDLPLDFVAVGEPLAASLRTLRPDARVLAVPPLIAGVGEPTEPADVNAEPLRVLVDDRWFQTPDDGPGRRAAGQVGCGAQVTYAEPGSGDRQFARLARGHHVVVRLDPVGGAHAVLPAMRAGCVPVVAESGLEGDVVTGERGIVMIPEDELGVARAIDRLSEDRQQLARLAAAAREHADAWPSEDESGAALLAALEQIGAEEPPPAARWPSRLMADAMGAIAVWRGEYFALSGYVRSVDEDETVRMARTVREQLDAPRMQALRRAARPVTRAVKQRLL